MTVHRSMLAHSHLPDRGVPVCQEWRRRRRRRRRPASLRRQYLAAPSSSAAALRRCDAALPVWCAFASFPGALAAESRRHRRNRPRRERLACNLGWCLVGRGRDGRVGPGRFAATRGTTSWNVRNMQGPGEDLVIRNPVCALWIAREREG